MPFLVENRDSPEEVVAVGGHTDSCDVDSEAVNDDAGCFMAWEVMGQWACWIDPLGGLSEMCFGPLKKMGLQEDGSMLPTAWRPAHS